MFSNDINRLLRLATNPECHSGHSQKHIVYRVDYRLILLLWTIYSLNTDSTYVPLKGTAVLRS
jgi:hypothetical protein